MKMRTRLATLALLVPLVAGCAAATGPAGGTPPREANRLRVEEIRQAQAQNGFELIRTLRPLWLQGRGSNSLGSSRGGEVVVYLNGSRAGTPEILRQIPSRDFWEALFLSPSEATARYGTGHTRGAIVISTLPR